MLILKTNSPKAKLQDSQLITVDPQSENDILNKTMRPILMGNHENQFTLLLPLKDNAKSKTYDDIDFSGCIQPIVFEFDHDTLIHQKERINKFTEIMNVSSIAIYSGNKSIHHVVWFKHFADSPEDYKEKAFKFLYYMSKKLPKYYSYGTSDSADDPNIPDPSLFRACSHFRQAYGYRPESQKTQKAKLFKSQEKILDLNTIVQNIKLPKIQQKSKNRQNVSINPSGKQLDTSTKSPQNVDQHTKKSILVLEQLIKEKMNLRSYLLSQGYIDEKILKEDNLKINPCPICGHKDCFNYRNGEDSYYCHSTSHKKGGKLLEFVTELHNNKCNIALFKICDQNIDELFLDEKPSYIIELISNSSISSKNQKKLISKIIIEFLKNSGDFLKSENRLFYYFRETNFVYQIETDSKKINDFTSFIYEQFGINSSDSVFKYIATDIGNYTNNEAPTVEIQKFVYYDDKNNVLYLQNGSKYYYKISENNIEKQGNGDNGIYFDSDFKIDEFEYLNTINAPSSLNTWDKLLISKLNLADEAYNQNEKLLTRLILKYYIKLIPFLFSRPTKPLVSFVGDKASGKTTFLRSLFSIILGRENFNVVSFSSKLEKEWTTLISQNKFLVVDNCDNLKNKEWFQDSLATVSTGQFIQTRELFTTNKLSEYKVNILLGLTGRTPSFNRDDVNDRSLIFFLEPIDHSTLTSAYQIQSEIEKKRNLLMTELLNSAQDTLQKLKINENLNVPAHIRIADFSELIYKTMETNERSKYSDIIAQINKSQISFSTVNNHLYSVLNDFCSDNINKFPLHITTSELFYELEKTLPKDHVFHKKYSIQNLTKSIKNVLPKFNQYNPYDISISDNKTGNKTHLEIRLTQ